MNNRLGFCGGQPKSFIEHLTIGRQTDGFYQITYGLFHSDHTIISGLETELTVMSAIMSQNLPNETAWHLRASRRVGISSEGVERLQQTVEAISEWSGRKLDRVCRVKDVEHEV